MSPAISESLPWRACAAVQGLDQRKTAMWTKAVLLMTLCGVYAVGTALFLDGTLEERTAEDVRVLSDNPAFAAETRMAHRLRNESYAFGGGLLALLGAALFWPDLKEAWLKLRT